MEDIYNFTIEVDNGIIHILKFKNEYIEEIKKILNDEHIIYVDFDKYLTIAGDRQCMKALYLLTLEFYIRLE